MDGFLTALRTQRWDDHRYYHHSRINQSLHFVSAISFLFSYVMIFKDPAISAMAGWLVSMTTRQCGHFFFEPKTYDISDRNRAEEIFFFWAGRGELFLMISLVLNNGRQYLPESFLAQTKRGLGQVVRTS